MRGVGSSVGTDVTVTNLDNGHAVTCTIVERTGTEQSPGRLVLDTDVVRPSSPTWSHAPIPVAHHLAGDAARPRQAAELLAAHGLAPRRALGQNFVVDPNTVRRIARLADVGPGDHVVEIGAGLGSLTRALAETGADGHRRRGRPRAWSPVLRDEVAPLERHAWSRATPCASTGPRCSRGARRVGARRQPALQRGHAARGRPARRRARRSSRMLVMVQREVGERLAAPARHAGLRRRSA